MEDQQVSEPETSVPLVPTGFNHQESESLITERSTEVITQESGLRITQASVISESGRVESNIEFSTTSHSTQAERSNSSYSSRQTTTHQDTVTSSEEISDKKTAAECQVVAESKTVVNQEATTTTQTESTTMTSSYESTIPVSLVSDEIPEVQAVPDEVQPPIVRDAPQEISSSPTAEAEVQQSNETTCPSAMDCSEPEVVRQVLDAGTLESTEQVAESTSRPMEMSSEEKVDENVPSSAKDGEIAQEKIKSALHEIISEIDKEVEEDFQNDEVNQETGDTVLVNQTGEMAQKKRSPPPVLPKRRPVSVPSFPTYEDGTEESPGSSTPISLQKLLTPAVDSSGELTPGTRKRRMFASSSFYSPLHPTMEEQVELARQISQSLSSENNTQSKGQSMYVKRRNRSFKWIHESEEGEIIRKEESCREEVSSSQEPLLSFKIPHVGPQEVKFREKSPLKLVMNPRGQVIDFHTLRNSGLFDELTAAPASPEICSSLVKDLHTPKGKGAALFAKRKEKSEKWVIDGTNKKPAETPAPQAPMAPPTAAATATTATTNIRSEQLQKMKEIEERINAPRVKLIKSPWDAALEDGSVDKAFEEVRPPLTKSLQAVIPLASPTTQEVEPTPSPAWVQSSQLVNPNLKPLEIKPKMVPFRPVSMNLTANPVSNVSPGPSAQPKPEPPSQSLPLRQPPPQAEPKPQLQDPQLFADLTKPAASNVDLHQPSTVKGWSQPLEEMTELAEFEEIVAALTNECPEQAPVLEEPLVTSHLKHVEEQPKPPPVVSVPPEFAKVQLRAVAPPDTAVALTSSSALPATDYLPALPVATAPPVFAKVQLRSVAPADTALAPPSSSVQPATEWLPPPPLNSRPNLQALLEKESQSHPANDAPEEPSLPTTSPAIQALLEREVRPYVKEATPEHVRLARETELVKLSVRRKVQRFEAASGRSPTPTRPSSTTATPLGSRRGVSPALIQSKPAAVPQLIKRQPAPSPSHPMLPLQPATPPEFVSTDAPLLPALNGPAATTVTREHYTSSCSVKETKQTIIQTTQTIQNPPPLVKKVPEVPEIVKANPIPAPSHVFTPPVMRRATQTISSTNTTSHSGNCKGLSVVDNAAKRKSLADFTNYNTAPRGWNLTQEFYRPVTFRVN